MPYSNTHSEFVRNLDAQNAMRNTITENGFNPNLISENNFHSHLVTENNSFAFPSAVSYQPIYSTANMTGLGLLPSHSGPRGLPLPVRSVQVRRSRGQLRRHIRYIASRLHPALSVKVSRVQSTRLPTSTFVAVCCRRCTPTTTSRLLRQLDFRFRCRCVRLPVRLLLYHIHPQRRTACTLVTFMDICRRCLWIILLLFRRLR